MDDSFSEPESSGEESLDGLAIFDDDLDGSESDNSDDVQDSGDDNDSSSDVDSSDSEDGDYNYNESEDDDDVRTAINNSKGEDEETAEISKEGNKSPAESDESSSSDENSDRHPKCPICLYSLSKRTIAAPSSGCIHTFCLDCLREWSRNINTCPIDRSEFEYIIIKDWSSGKEISREKVLKEKKRQTQEEVPAEPDIIEDQTLCEVCGSGDREDSLLLCDACDLGYHLECCDPPLESVPRGRWYCSTCSRTGLVSDFIRRQRRRQAASSAIESDEEEDALPRTIEMERVRRAVRRHRIEENAHENESTPATGSGRRKKTRKGKKKSTKRKKKTTKRKSTSSSKTSKSSKTKGTKRKRKKLTKRQKRKLKRIKKRKEKKENKEKSERERAERGETHFGPVLSIFGDVNDLDFYGDEELFTNPTPSTSRGWSQPVNPAPPVEEPADLLASIMASQTTTLTLNKKPVLSKPKEVYTKPENMTKDESKIISTSVSRSILNQKNKASSSSKSESKVDRLGQGASAVSVPAQSKGVRFSDHVETKSLKSNKIEFKVPDSNNFRSFKIPKKRPLDVNADHNKSEQPNEAKVAKVFPTVRQSSADEDLSEERKVDKKSAQTSNGSSANKTDTKVMPQLSDIGKFPCLETTRKLRLAHFEKLGFKSVSPERSPKDEEEGVRVFLNGKQLKFNQKEPQMTSRDGKEKIPESPDPTLHTASNSSLEPTSNSTKVHFTKKEEDFQEFLDNVLKACLKPFFNKGRISKESYKTIMKKAFLKIQNSTSNKKELVNKEKVQKLVEAYVHKYSK